MVTSAEEVVFEMPIKTQPGHLVVYKKNTPLAVCYCKKKKKAPKVWLWDQKDTNMATFWRQPSKYSAG